MTTKIDLRAASIALLSRLETGSTEYEQLYAKLLHAGEFTRCKKKRYKERYAPRPKRDVNEIQHLHDMITGLLYDHSFLTAGQIASMLNLPIGTANHHLRTMDAKGAVIQSRAEKRKKNFSHWSWSLPTHVIESMNKRNEPTGVTWP